MMITLLLGILTLSIAAVMAVIAFRITSGRSRTACPIAGPNASNAIDEAPAGTGSRIDELSLLRSRVRSGDILAQPRDAYDKLNSQVVELLGFSIEDLRRDPPMLVRRMHPDDRRRYYTSEDRLVHTQRHTILEHRFLHRDGNYRWIRRDIHRVEDRRGILTEFECQASEIIEMRSDESRPRLDLNMMPCAAGAIGGRWEARE